MNKGLISLLLLASGVRFIDLWMTPDQQGRYQFEQGNYPAAADLFEDPLWKGLSHYKAEDWSTAVNWFALLNSAEALFYQGNCYARLEDLEAAADAYRQALEKAPGFIEAEENLQLVLSLMPEGEELKEEEGEPSDPTFEADQVEFSEKGEQGKAGEVDEMKLTPEQMAEIWMRSIQTTPADFLRQKFYIQASRAGAGEEQIR